MGKQQKHKADSDDFFRRPFELKSLDETGAFAGYAAVWDDVDQVDDVCVKGCFAQSLAAWSARGTLPRVKLMHFETIGHLTAWREDDHGLYVEGKLWDTERARQIRADVEKAKANDQDPTVGMSFAFVPIDFTIENNIRYLKQVDVQDDITITPRPVNTATEVLEVKSSEDPQPSIRTAEGVLRDAGFSRKSARAILAGGFSHSLRAAGRTENQIPDGVAAEARAIAAFLKTI